VIHERDAQRHLLIAQLLREVHWYQHR